MSNSTLSSTLRYIRIVFFILLGMIVIYFWVAPKALTGTILEPAELAYDFDLKAADKNVRLSDYRGKVVLLYFGYTFCPDICPATLGTVSQAFESLGQRAENVQLIMISVDPLRDRPEILGEYVTHFHPSFIGVTGTEEEIAEVADSYFIFYEAREGTPATGYLVDHTTTLMGIDKEGHLKLLIPFGATAEEIANSLNFLMR